jgi:predicted amidohydrolase YtcJ
VCTARRKNASDLVNPGKWISRLEAFKIYTERSACFSFGKDKLGTIETRKLGDLVVLRPLESVR